jgi:hypothetical protein
MSLTRSPKVDDGNEFDGVRGEFGSGSRCWSWLCSGGSMAGSGAGSGSWASRMGPVVGPRMGPRVGPGLEWVPGVGPGRESHGRESHGMSPMGVGPGSGSR